MSSRSPFAFIAEPNSPKPINNMYGGGAPHNLDGLSLTRSRDETAKSYDEIEAPSKGAWVVHHGQKTAATVLGAAEFPALDTASKAASLLSQLAATEESTVDKIKVDALAKAAGLNPRIELPALLNLLEQHRVIHRSASGAVAILGVTSRATVQHAAAIFEDQEPTPEERASILLAELTSVAPVSNTSAKELISDEFRLASGQVQEFLQRSETIGFVDAEGRDADKLYFNGNIFRRDNLAKAKNVLDSLTTVEKAKATELDERLTKFGCIAVLAAEQMLGTQLFEKLKAAGMYDVNHIANPSGEFGFVTKPPAFHKFNDPLVDDAFDLAKALVAALTYGKTQSSSGRGRIEMMALLLRKLINGGEVGPATAIGEDYRVLETKGVIRVTRAQPFGFMMRLLKRDIGEMALKVLTTGEAASTNIVDRPLPGKMTGYSGPEKTRSDFRRKQVPESKRMTHDVLEALRTQGTF